MIESENSSPNSMKPCPIAPMPTTKRYTNATIIPSWRVISQCRVKNFSIGQQNSQSDEFSTGYRRVVGLYGRGYALVMARSAGDVSTGG